MTTERTRLIEARARARKAKERQEKAKRRKSLEENKRLGEYRDMADKVAEYFDNATDEELDVDLRKARFDFCKLIKMKILP